MRLLLLTNVTISLPLIIQSDLDETERVRFDDQGFESCLLNHADDLSSSDPRSRYRVLFRVAYVTPQSRIGHEVLFRHVLPHSRCRFALPSSPSFGLLPSLGGSADDQLMIIHLDDVMVAQSHREEIAGSLLLLPRSPKRRLDRWVGLDRRRISRATKQVEIDSLPSHLSYRPDLSTSYHSQTNSLITHASSTQETPRPHTNTRYTAHNTTTPPISRTR
jgi:hypothetical protein